jgi:hypothetical protein
MAVPRINLGGTMATLDKNYLWDGEPRTAAEVRQRARDVVARRAKWRVRSGPELAAVEEGGSAGVSGSIACGRSGHVRTIRFSHPPRHIAGDGLQPLIG